MNLSRLHEITSAYSRLRIALVGDVCLDRYFEIDPALNEISIETGLTVYNVTRVRCQPGAAGTILNNLVALGVGQISLVAITGDDGEGFELRRALGKMKSVALDHLITSPERSTFTYSKPLVLAKGKAPEELNRLDIKNWSPTPERLSSAIANSIRDLAPSVDAIILLDQVDLAETGVITRTVLNAVEDVASKHSDLLILADSRRSLRDFPMIGYKMNAAELAAMSGRSSVADLESVKSQTQNLSAKTSRPVFVTLSENGIVAADRSEAIHVPALPVRGEIDIVGAGDSVTANLTAALAAGAKLREALELAMLASSSVIHQLGTTGTASPEQLAELLPLAPFSAKGNL